MKNLLTEFRKFVMRGNVLELAVAVILGIAFGAVVTSFTNDIMMALIGAIFGKPGFEDLTLEVGDGIIAYGAFINTVVNFLLVALSLFIVIKSVEKLQGLRGGPAEEEEPLTRGEELLTEIRDLLRQDAA